MRGTQSGQPKMSMQHLGRRHWIDLELQRMGEVCLKRKLKRRHDGVGEFFIGCGVKHDGTGSFGHQIKQPFRHVFIERGQHGQQIFLPALLEESLQRIDRRVRVTVIVTAGVDEMDQISSERIRTRPTLHAILQAGNVEP